MAATVTIDLNEIHSLTDFQRNAKDHIMRMKKTKRPLVLTVNGKAEVIVQDKESYQKILEDLETAQTLLAIQQGLDDLRQGKTKPARQFLEELRKELKIEKPR